MPVMPRGTKSNCQLDDLGAIRSIPTWQIHDRYPWDVTSIDAGRVFIDWRLSRQLKLVIIIIVLYRTSDFIFHHARSLLPVISGPDCDISR